MKFIATLVLSTAAIIGSSAGAEPLSPSVASAAATTTTAQDGRAINHAPYNMFLSKYVRTVEGVNLVEYGNVRAVDKASLKKYVRALESQRPSTMSTQEELAFWFNLYNAKTIEIILDNYPVSSIRQIGGGFISKGPWKSDVVTVEGRAMSLDDIEHNTVRKKFNEPRVHYAFNCASIGCPNLKKNAWVASTLERDLDTAARDYVAHARGIEVKNGRVVASSIYNWFKRDFGNNDQDVLNHIRKYATGDKLRQLQGVKKINGYQYNWSLNETM